MPEFEVGAYLTPREAVRLDRCSVLGLAAAADAVQDAGGLAGTAERRAVVAGTAHGGTQTQEHCLTSTEPGTPGSPRALHIPLIMFNASAAWISMSFDAKGPSLCVTTACASGTQAVGEAFRLIKYGQADTAIT
ncbi:hypothetical protein KK483_01655 [Streptomyces sp. FIT100]|nr:hypothetical protein KK483_01655 [Streptomyces sp. FIT100]